MPKPEAGKAAMYTGMIDCFSKSVKGEGPAILMRCVCMYIHVDVCMDFHI